MPIAPTHPGVYVEEVSSGVRTISGVATAITAFVGYTRRGPDNRAVRIMGFADFERTFGGLDAESEVSYAVQQFFQNGGGEAHVVRTPKFEAAAASITAGDKVTSASADSVRFTAISKGAWGNELAIYVDYDSVSDDKSFNLTINDSATGLSETFQNVTVADSARNVASVVNDESSGSSMITVAVVDSAKRPAATGTAGAAVDATQITDTSKAWKTLVSLDVPKVGSSPTPKIKDLEVTVLDIGEARPSSVHGWCALLQRKVNLALDAAASRATNPIPAGAAIACSPTAEGGIRVRADVHIESLGGARDAKISFRPLPDTSTDGDADAGLMLSAASAAGNVAHYWPSTDRRVTGAADLAVKSVVAGADGTKLPKTADLIGTESAFTGIYALKKVDLFNLLCIPEATRAEPGHPGRQDPDVDTNAVYAAAMKLCEDRRTFLLVDPPPDVSTPDAAVDWRTSGLTVTGANGAAYFPRLRLPDPLNAYKLRTFAPCGVMAGLFNRTDATRGIWKAPAGVDASLSGVQGMVYQLNDGENGLINPLGLNALRTLPIYGSVSWGARTLRGSNAEASEWKYVPVRRMALYLEESLFRGLKWVVFEPNDEPLWAQVRLNVGAFMNNLFRQGAFQGQTPKDAYLVKCDAETTTQTDINAGIVNILVGFAPLKPAEFVYLRLQQLAGQIQS